MAALSVGVDGHPNRTMSAATVARGTDTSTPIAAAGSDSYGWRRLRRLALLAAVLLVPMVTAERADAHTVFGGVIGPTYEAFGLELNALPGQEELSPAMGRVEFHARIRCPGARPDLALAVGQRIVAPGVPAGPTELQGRAISADGHFEASGTTRYRFGDLKGKVEEDFTGTIIGDVIEGTFRATARLTKPDSGRRVATCRSGELHWRGESAPGRVFAGLTSTGDPVMLKLSEDRVQVLLMLVAGHTTCTGSDAAITSNVWIALPVRPDGRFTGGDLVSVPRRRAILVRGSDQVRGHVNGDRATGSWQDAWTETTRNGAVSRCRVARARWSARSS